MQLEAADPRGLRLAAIRRLAYEASDCGLLSPDLAAGIRRVKGVRRLGLFRTYCAGVKEPYLTSLWLHFHKQISVEFNRQMRTVS